MEILGVGPLEALLIVVLALIVIGPRELGSTARSLGRTLNRIYRSETWQGLTQASRSLRGLPRRLAREAALEELDQASREVAAGTRLPGPSGQPANPKPDRSDPPPAPAEPAPEAPAEPGEASPPKPAKPRATKLPSGTVTRKGDRAGQKQPSRRRQTPAGPRRKARKKGGRTARPSAPRPKPRRGRSR